MGHPVVHFEVHTEDSAVLREFYSEIFGWKLGVVPDGSYARVDTDAGGAGIIGGIAQAADGLTGVMFYIQVPDIDEHLARIEAAGGTVLMPRAESPMITTAIFTDPDGNRVGLTER